MADIFISYSRSDRARADTLARELGRHGWAVWWDREIPPGKTFDEVIEEALTNAKCVIVLWSRESVQSEWVKAEASEAAKRRVLVPILADEVKIPLEFRRIQSARLTDWNDLPANPDWDQLEQALATLVGQRAKTQPPRAPIAPTRQPAAWWRTAPLAAGVTLLALLAVGYMSFSPKPAVDVQPSVAAPRAPVPVLVEPEKPVVPDVLPTPDHVRTSPERPDRRQPADVAAVIPSGPRKDPDPVVPKPMASALPAVAVSLRPEPPARVSDQSFDVTHTRGVFRNQAGRLTVSADGVRYRESGDGGSRAGFEVACGEIRTVETPNLIVDREQRMLEIGLRDRSSYRFVAADTSARDGIVSSLSRACGPR